LCAARSGYPSLASDAPRMQNEPTKINSPLIIRTRPSANFAAADQRRPILQNWELLPVRSLLWSAWMLIGVSGATLCRSRSTAFSHLNIHICTPEPLAFRMQPRRGANGQKCNAGQQSMTPSELPMRRERFLEPHAITINVGDDSSSRTGSTPIRMFMNPRSVASVSYARP
jgi:hypothetical protein